MTAKDDILTMFPFTRELSENRIEVLAEVLNSVGFLGMVKRRSLIESSRKGHIWEACQQLEDFPHLEKKYRAG